MKRYVVGFMTDGKNVLLTEKDRPEIWKGLHTGPGGKIEQWETSPQAMVREFREETGILTTSDDWRHAATVNTGDYTVDFYISIGDPRRFEQIESEKLEVFSIHRLPVVMFDNARWALALALDPAIKGPVVVNYFAHHTKQMAPCPPPEAKPLGRHGVPTNCHELAKVAD